MKENIKEKDGIYSMLVLGVKNPQTNTMENLLEAKLSIMKHVLREEYIVPVDDGIYQIHVVNYLHDKYGLEGVIGMGVSVNKESLNSVLTNLLAISKSTILDQETYSDAPVLEQYNKVLDDMVEGYIKSLLVGNENIN